MSGRKQTAAVWCAGILAASLFAPSASAHRRPWHHRHGQPLARAEILFGMPRPVRRAVVINGVAHGTLDLNVRPRTTEVWVDGELRGTCAAFDGHPAKLHLPPGAHRVKLVTPDGVTVSRALRVSAGTETNVGLDLR